MAPTAPNRLPLALCTAFVAATFLGTTLAMAQTVGRTSQMTIDGKDVRIQVQDERPSLPTQSPTPARRVEGVLFPVVPNDINGQGFARPPLQTQELPDSEQMAEFAIPPLPLLANNVQPSASPKIRWLLFQASDRSANTGQLTCLGWARSLNVAKALETEGPFNAAVASASMREDLSVGAFWNNAAEATMVPLAAKWDIPVWSQSAANEPLGALSALYQFSKTAKGSATIAVSWESEHLERFQAAWLEGLAKSGDIDGLQSLSMKQRIRKWSTTDRSRLDVMEYSVEAGKIKNVQWRSLNMKISGSNHGCPPS